MAKYLVFFLAIVVNFTGHTNSFGILGVGKKITGGLGFGAGAAYEHTSDKEVGGVIGVGKKVTGGLGVGFGVGHKRRSDGHGEYGVHVEKNVLGLNEQAGVGVGDDGKVNVGYGIGLGGAGDGQVSSDSQRSLGIDTEKAVTTEHHGEGSVGADGYAQSEGRSHGSVGGVLGFGKKVTGGLGVGAGVGYERRSDGHGGYGVHVEKNVFGLNEQAGVGVGDDGKVNVGYGIGLEGEGNGQVSSHSQRSLGIDGEKAVTTEHRGDGSVGADGYAQTEGRSHGSVGGVLGFGKKVTGGLGVGAGVGHERRSDGHGGYGVHVEKNVFGLNEQAGVGVGDDGKVNVGYGIGLGGAGDGQVSSDSQKSLGIDGEKAVTTEHRGDGSVGADGYAQTEGRSHGSVGGVLGFGKKVTGGLGVGAGVGHERRSDGHGGYGVHVEKNVFGLNEQAGVGVGDDGKVNVGYGIGLGGAGDGQVGSHSQKSLGIDAEKAVATEHHGDGSVGADGYAQTEGRSHGSVGGVLGFGKKVTGGLGVGAGVGHERRSDGHGGYGVHVEKNVFGLNEQAGVGVGDDGKVNVGYGIGLGGAGDGQVGSHSQKSLGIDAEKAVATEHHGDGSVGADGYAQTEGRSHGSVGGVLGFGKKVTGGLGVGAGVGYERRSDGHGGYGVHVEKNVFGLNEQAGVGVGDDGKVNVGYGIGLEGEGNGQVSSDSQRSLGIDAEKTVTTEYHGDGRVGADGYAQTESRNHGSVGGVLGFGKKVTGGLGVGAGVGYERPSDGHGGYGVHVEKNVFGLNEQAGVGVGDDGKLNVGYGIGLGGAGDGQVSSHSQKSLGIDAEKAVTTKHRGDGSVGADGYAQTEGRSHGSVGGVLGFGKKVTGGLGVGAGVGYERRSDGHGGYGVHVEKNVFGLNEQAGVGVGDDGKVNLGYGIGLGGAGDGQVRSDSQRSLGIDTEKAVTTEHHGEGIVGADGYAQTEGRSHGSVGGVLGFGKKLTGGLGVGAGVGYERRSDGHGGYGVHVEKNVFGLNEQAGVGVGDDIGLGGEGNGQVSSDSQRSLGIDAEKTVTTEHHGDGNVGVDGYAQTEGRSHGSVGGVLGFGKKLTGGLGVGAGVGYERRSDGHGGYGVHVEKNVFGLNEQAGVGVGDDGKVNVGYGIGLGGEGNGQVSSDSQRSLGIDAEKTVTTEHHGDGNVGVDGYAQTEGRSHGSVGGVLGFGKKVTGGLGVGFGVGHERRSDGHGGYGVHVEKNVFGLNEQAGVGVGDDGKINVGYGIGLGGAGDGQVSSDSQKSLGIDGEKAVTTEHRGDGSVGADGYAQTEGRSHGSVGGVLGFGKKLTGGLGVGAGVGYERRSDGHGGYGVHVEKNVFGLNEQAGVGVGDDGKVNVGYGIGLGGAGDGQVGSHSQKSLGIDAEKAVATEHHGDGSVGADGYAQTEGRSHGSVGGVLGFGKKVTGGLGVGAGVGHERRSDGHGGYGVHVEKNVFGLNEQAGVGVGDDGKVNVGYGIGLGGAGDGQVGSHSQKSLGIDAEKAVATEHHGDGSVGADGYAQTEGRSHGSVGGVLGFGKKVTGGLGVGAGVGYERRSDGHGGYGVHVEKNVFGLNEQAGVGVGDDGKVNVGYGIGLEGEGNGQVSSDSQRSLGIDAEKTVTTEYHGDGRVGADGYAQTESRNHGSVGGVLGFGKKVTGGLGVGAGVGYERPSDGHGGYGVHVEKNVFGLNEQAGVGVGDDGKLNVGYGIGLGGAGDGQVSSHSQKSLGIDAEKAVTTKHRGDGSVGADGYAQTEGRSHGSVGGVLGFGKKVTGGLGVGAGVGYERRSDGHGGYGVHVEKNVFGLNEQAGVGVGDDGKVNLGYGIGLGGAGDGQVRSDSQRSLGIDTEKAVTTEHHGEGIVGADGYAQTEGRSHGSVGGVLGFGKKLTGGLGVGAGVGYERRSDGHGGYGVHVEKNVFGLNEQAGVGVGDDIGLGGEGNGQVSSDSQRSLGIDAEKTVTTEHHGDGNVGVDGYAQTEGRSHGSVGGVLGFGKKLTGGLGVGAGVGYERRSDGHGGYGVHVEKNVFGLNEQAGVGVGDDGKVNVGYGIGLGGEGNGQVSSDSQRSLGIDAEKTVTTEHHGDGNVGVDGYAQTEGRSHGSVGGVLGFGKKVTGGLGVGFGVGHERRSDGHGGYGVHVEKNVFGLNEQAGVGVGDDGKINVGYGIGLGGAGDGQVSSDSQKSLGIDGEKAVTTEHRGDGSVGADGYAQTEGRSHGSVGGVLGFGKKLTGGLGVGAGVGYERRSDGHGGYGVHVEKNVFGLNEQAGVGVGDDGKVNVGYGIGLGGAGDGQVRSDSQRSLGIDTEKAVTTEHHGEGIVGADGYAQTEGRSHGSVGGVLGFEKKVTGGLGVGFGAGHERRSDGHGEYGVHVEKNVLGLNEQAGVGVGDDGKVNVGYGIGLGGAGDGQVRSDSQRSLGIDTEKAVTTEHRGDGSVGAGGYAQTEGRSHGSVGGVLGFGKKVTGGLGVGFGVGRRNDGHGGYGVHVEKNVFGLNEQAGVGVGDDGKVNVGFGIGFGGRGGTGFGNRTGNSHSSGGTGLFRIG